MGQAVHVGVQAGLARVDAWGQRGHTWANGCPLGTACSAYGCAAVLRAGRRGGRGAAGLVRLWQRAQVGVRRMVHAGMWPAMAAQREGLGMCERPIAATLAVPECVLGWGGDWGAKSGYGRH